MKNTNNITVMMEKQRYDAIKASNEYYELNILVGADKVKCEDGATCNVPVVRLEGKNCDEVMIACMYLSIKSMLEELRKEYPAECLAADISAHVEKEPM